MTWRSLESFCIEMRAMAAKIKAPDEFIPMCGRGNRSGYSVDMSEDGSEYVFSASERGEPYELLRSSDRAKVMEVIFVDLTSRLAWTEVAKRSFPTGPWTSLFRSLGQPVALKQQREVQIVQEGLLGRIDDRWRQRAAIENALKLRGEVDFFFGIQ